MDFLLFYSFVVCVFFLFYFGSESFIKVLIFIEFMSVTLVTFYFIIYDFDFLYFSVYFLIFGVCEGVLGLSVLAMIINWYGSDYLLFSSLVF